MQSHVRSIDALLELAQGLCELGEGFDRVVQDTQAALHQARAWLEEEQPAYWKHQIRLAEQQVSVAEDRLMQVASTTHASDRPPATVEKKQLTLARRRLAFCLRQYQAIRRHRGEVEQAIERLAGPLAEVEEWVSARLPAARGELQQMVEVLQRYNRAVPPPSPKQ